MLTIYFKSPFTLERLGSGPSGPYLDGFAHKLHLAGYSQVIRNAPYGTVSYKSDSQSMA